MIREAGKVNEGRGSIQNTHRSSRFHRLLISLHKDKTQVQAKGGGMSAEAEVVSICERLLELQDRGDTNLAGAAAYSLKIFAASKDQRPRHPRLDALSTASATAP